MFNVTIVIEVVVLTVVAIVVTDIQVVRTCCGRFDPQHDDKIVGAILKHLNP